VPLAESANCVLIAGKRGGETRLAAALVLATTRADVNGAVRRLLDVRKCSFASRELATGESGMEYGGITPLGLPADWPVFVDAAVAAADRVVIGSGLRRSKLVLAGSVLAALPAASVWRGWPRRSSRPARRRNEPVNRTAEVLVDELVRAA